MDSSIIEESWLFHNIGKENRERWEFIAEGDLVTFLCGKLIGLGQGSLWGNRVSCENDFISVGDGFNKTLFISQNDDGTYKIQLIFHNYRLKDLSDWDKYLILISFVDVISRIVIPIKSLKSARN